MAVWLNMLITNQAKAQNLPKRMVGLWYSTNGLHKKRIGSVRATATSPRSVGFTSSTLAKTSGAQFPDLFQVVES